MSLFNFFKKGNDKPSKPYSNYLHIVPIDRETVDFADDFFFKLTDKQVDQKMIELHERQQQICIIIDAIYNKMRGIKQQRILFRMALVVDYCYSNYYNDIPFITQKKLMAFSKYMGNDLQEQLDAGIENRDTTKLMEGLNQPYLMEFLGLKQILYGEDLHILNNSECLEIGRFMTYVIPLYSEEIIIKN